MNAYNELDGVPVAADRDLLTDRPARRVGVRRLRRGRLLLDPPARRLPPPRRRRRARPRRWRSSAGLDVELPGTDCYGAPLLQAVRSGRVSAATVDTAVARVLRAKFELGLFEQPFVEPERVAAVTDTPAHRRAGPGDRRASRSCCCATTACCRWRPDVGTVAVIGPNADDARHLFGDYTYPAHVESLQELLKSGRNVFAMPIDDRHPLTAIDADATTTVAALRARLGSERELRSRLRRQQRVPRRLRRGRGARRRAPTSWCW